MDRNQAKEYIRSHPEEYLQRDNSGKGFICPCCGSGTGKTGTGITTKDGIHFTCWANCFTNSDIIDIIGLEYGLTATADKFNKAYEVYGLPVDQVAAAMEPAAEDFKEPYTQEQQEQQEGQDLSSFFSQAHSQAGQTDYFKQRGISQATIDRFNLGYVEKWQSPAALKKGFKPPATPRVIIPTGINSYVARDTRPSLTDTEKNFKNMKEGPSILFNDQALKNDQPTFITEGEFDALAIIEAGADAVALGSIANINQLVNYIKNSPPAGAGGLILALDNDEKGQEATKKLAAKLTALAIPFLVANVSGEYKDPNEALTADREQFTQEVQATQNNYNETLEAERNEERNNYLRTSTAYHVQEFMTGVMASANTPYIPTGFKELDTILDGGLFEGLYIIGAISSLGKTTFVLQIADQIAQQGQDVLIFSLEMARYELIAKSISRLTFLNCEGSRHHAKTTRGITTGKFYSNYSDQERELIIRSAGAYRGYAQNLYISEGMGNIGADQVRETVARHISFTGKSPVVVIDYLQLLAPYEPRATDKQNTDRSVMELKRISRDYKIPVLAISSFNRENYSQAVNMTAFKESGAIEYSSDVLIGLQATGAGTKEFNIETAKAKDPREVDLKILKNRNGVTGRTIYYKYYPKFNYFYELGEEMPFDGAI